MIGNERRVVVFGSSGFVGSRFGQKLDEAGFSVIGVDQAALSDKNDDPLSDRVRINLEQESDFSELTGDFDSAVFLAAALPLNGPPAKIERKNISIARSYERFLFEKRPRSAILVSSSSVYDAKSGSAFSEFSSPKPSRGYGYSKLLTERLLADAASKLDIPMTIIRPTAIVGKGREGLFESLKVLIEKKFPILLPTGSNCRFQVTDVNDLIRLMKFAVDNPTGGVWGAGNPEPKTLKEYALAIGDRLAIRPVIFDVPGTVLRRLGKAAAVAGFTNLTPWHFDAITHPHLFAEPRLPKDFRYSLTCTEAVTTSVDSWS